MIIDKLLRFSASQAITGTSAVVSTDLLDLGADRDFTALGRPLYLVVVVEASGGTSPTLAIDLQTDDNASFSSPAVIASRAALAAAARQVIIIPFPHTNERYLRLSYTQGGTSPTATLSAFITDAPDSWVALADQI